MAKTRTGYLTMDWTDPQGAKHVEGEALDLPYETDADRVDYESLVRVGMITHTARQAEKAADQRTAEPADQGLDKSERTSTGPGV